KARLKLNPFARSAFLALGEDAFFTAMNAKGKNFSILYKVDFDGNVEEVKNLPFITGAAAFSSDLKTLTYAATINGKLNIGLYNVETKEESRIVIQNNKEITESAGGDIAYDNDGYIWYVNDGNLISVDLENEEIKSVIPIKTSNGEVPTYQGTLAFLANGKLVSSGFIEGGHHHFTIDPSTGLIEKLNPIAHGYGDFASK